MQTTTNRKVKKAVIPVAGLGTRFLPATKSVPKELLPIVDAPILLYIVEEILDAGIEDIILVQGRGKTAIEDFFDISFELETKLREAKKEHFIDRIRYVRDRANFVSIRQKEALGLGHAVLSASHVVGNEPFAVLLGDEVMIGTPGVTRQLVDAYDRNHASTVAVMKVAPSEVVKYGIIDGEEFAPGQFKLRAVVEKPKMEVAPSQWALPGRYVFDAKLFDYLRETKAGVNGEVQLTDGMCGLAKEGNLYATTFQARRYDAGDKLGFLQANIELALEHPDLGVPLKEYLIELAKQWT